MNTAPTLRLACAIALLLAAADGPISHAQAKALRNCPPPSSTPESLPIEPIGHCGTPPLPYADGKRPIIQIALCLDTSGSMDGLLNQARTRLWEVVNFLAAAKAKGETPVLQVAIYQYGTTQASSRDGFIRCIQPFTSDLDLISERLFSLRIGGSVEECGRVMSTALEDLAWREHSTRNNEAPAYRTLVIAGNEEFTQGTVNYKHVVESAKCRATFVNTIYCGSQEEGARTGWLNAAYLNGGSFHSIDQSRREEYVPCSQDEALLRLNAELNSTYAAYTRGGGAAAARQIAQDNENLAASREGAMKRVASKASSLYSNSDWDLVDAVKERSVELKDISTDNLPENMRGMDLRAREAHVNALIAQRERIQEQIRRLNNEREAELRRRRTENANHANLGSALIASIRAQAERLGFVFAPD